MARWKELSDSLDQRERQLVVQLRRLKDRSGLSLAALAAKTTYSSSSWERWLNGKKPVPRGAVTELARVCGTDPTRLLVLHEVAEGARGEASEASGAESEEASAASRTKRTKRTTLTSRTTADEPGRGRGFRPGAAASTAAAAGTGAAAGTRAGVGTRTGPGARRGRLLSAATVAVRPLPGSPGSPGLRRSEMSATRPRHRFVLGAAAALLVAFGAGMITGLSWQDDSRDDSGGQQAAVAADNYRRGQTYDCDISRKDGGLYAGHSASEKALLDINSIGWDVVEAQCLLARHGFDPGDTDGVYGEKTKSAALAFQEKRGIAVDGIVGPDTWRELRK
ncbi:helix-turn-helix domain-containing protein [Streptomyces sp. HC44]|uniref:Helix-turn-helix domain-containing protein n=1 Tax=Streptomyces scabichelini TaxID=2711217 RepID=A0A6G4VMN9_9ACTN|nr:peptidoglycan-binding protein [Streptomyces scabichelini]NGO15366.1 helix-turn-helix domain-containing protein [Streptomyces scabichelini]